MPTVARHQQYDVHFYCALCGGPFAEVFRTAVAAEPQPNPCINDERLDTDPRGEFNVPEDENYCIPEEAVMEDMSYTAQRARKKRVQAQREGKRRGMMPEPREAMRAYDGRRITTKQMEWTRNLRALIHRDSNYQPVRWEQFIGEETVYLSGRGLVRKMGSWADAYCSVDDDEDDGGSGDVLFPAAARARNDYGIHMYKEMNGERVDSFIGSIPFHDECWSMLVLAIEQTGKEVNISRIYELISTDEYWSRMRDLITVSGRKQEVITPLPSETKRQLVTRLAEVDYREAQSGGEGYRWKHEVGCHWTVADPSLTSVLENPLISKPLLTTQPPPARRRLRAASDDVFNKLPAEIILMIANNLDAPDVFSLRIASPAVCIIDIPDSFYRRFIMEEFRHLNRMIINQIQRNESVIWDWKGSFERLVGLIRTPNSQNRGWEGVDIGLKNRHRIWKIVKPIADVIVHTSTYALHQVHSMPELVSEKTNLVRGFVGARSGDRGEMKSTYLLGRKQMYPTAADKDPEEPPLEYEPGSHIEMIHVWHDSLDSESRGAFCGFGFDVVTEGEMEIQGQSKTRIFGRQGPEVYKVLLSDRELLGFRFCLSEGIVSGIQVLYDDRQCVRYQPLEKETKFGRWDDGVVREVRVPTSWRRLVGMVGFMNSTGYFETIGLLEQKLPQQEICPRGFGPLTAAPDVVPLTHEEASVWKARRPLPGAKWTNSVPPPGVQLREREGPEIHDWRVNGAEWQLWDSESVNGFRLSAITGFSDGKLLRGLRFHYDHIDGSEIYQDLGREIGQSSTFWIEQSESIIACVICFSDEGVHSVQFVTNEDRTSEPFGPRYRGTHTVFAPPPNPFDRRRKNRRSGRREEINAKIIGLHALYDYEDGRFLQLGIILPPDSNDMSRIYPNMVSCMIPFDEIDESDGVWSDGAPPPDWIIGSERMLNGNFRALESVIGSGYIGYTGWADFEDLERLTIYGDMKGIEFTYYDEKMSRVFGNVEHDITSEQTFAQGEQIIGIAAQGEWDETKESKPSGTEDDVQSIVSASSTDEQIVLDKLVLLTLDSKSRTQKSRYSRVADSPDLCGIKIDFNYRQIVDWSPAYCPSEAKRDEVAARVRQPWKSSDPTVVADPAFPIPLESECVSVSFEPTIQGSVTAVKGYVDRKGSFAGLLLRRGKSWEKQVFGRRTGFELMLEMMEGEYLDSLFLAQPINGRPFFDGLAICTSRGRVSPWFGKMEDKTKVYRHRPQSGYLTVGIFGSFSDLPYQGAPQWDSLGLLWRPSSQCSSSLIPKPRNTPTSGLHLMDPVTKIPWLNDYPSRPDNIAFTPLHRHRHSPSSRDPSSTGRGYCLFDPSQLRQIRVWSRQSGLAGIRLHGTPEMGIITLNEWPDVEGIKLSRAHKMTIDGPGGERIVSMTVAFQEDRVVGVLFRTNRGNEKIISSPSVMPEKPLELTLNDVETMEVGHGSEVCGFHGMFGVWNVNDLGLVVRKVGGDDDGQSRQQNGDLDKVIYEDQKVNGDLGEDSEEEEEDDYSSEEYDEDDEEEEEYDDEESEDESRM